MGHFRSNLRDITFNLFELFDRQAVYGSGPFRDLDEDTVRTILVEAERVAAGPVADSFGESDRNPPVFDPDTGSVTMPQIFRDAYQAWMDAGYYQLELSPEYGGQGAPPSLNWAISEIAQAANPTVHMFSMGAWFAQLLGTIGNADQKRFAALAIENRWTSTMALTEPDAGSDVGAGRTKAVEQPDGTWHIEGVKRFITGAENDLAGNIFHLVLARPVGAAAGTKGLSMFLVPKYLVDLQTGALGDRNGVYVTNLERKMGIKVSPTCELTFGARHPAVGYLVGDVHDGMRQMFLVIEHARMTVGTKALGTLSSGYLNALAYAKERVQGADLTRLEDKTAPRVLITRHADVRRSLMRQKAYVEGLRALIMQAAVYQDEIELARHDGRDVRDTTDLNDFLLPVVKAVTSERAYELLGSEALQTLGGSGFLQDYPLEQYVRDVKIDTLYEGTTAIQGLDLFFRNIVRDDGATFDLLAARIRSTLTDLEDIGQLKDERLRIDQALRDVTDMVEHLLTWWSQATDAPETVYKVGLSSSRLLMAIGDLLVAWMLAKQTVVALSALERELSQGDLNFYLGKVAAAQFFCATVLPRLGSELEIVEATDLTLMHVPDEAF